MSFDTILNAFGLQRRQWNDEPDKPGSFYVPEHWVGKIWPRSDAYRIVEYELRALNRYGLQAKVGNDWIDVLKYDTGHDGDGKLYAGKWEKLADCCSWEINRLQRLRDIILGKPEVAVPIIEQEEKEERPSLLPSR